jgi:ABC-type multidrug transport system fused ATPase/permease subunit
MTTIDQGDTWRLLRPFMLRHWHSLAGAMVATATMTAASLAAPWPLKLAIDHIAARSSGAGGFTLERDDWWLLSVLALSVLAIAAVGAVSSYLVDFWLNRAGERIVHALRVATYAQLQRLSLAFHARRHKGDLVTRVTADVNAVGTLFADTVGTLVAAFLTLVGMFVVCMFLDPLLTGAVFLLAPLLYLVVRHYQVVVRRAARKQRAKDGEIASLATEALTAMPVIKAFGTEQFEHDRVERVSEERLEVGVLAVRLEARFGGLVDMLGAVSTAIILALGVVSVAQGRISAGTLVVFVAYSGKLYKPLRDIARQTTRWSRTMARLERIGEILRCDEVLEERGTPVGRSRRRASGEIRLDRVSFRYSPDRWAVRDVDLHVPAGQTVALVGASGAGKSTVGALVARFYDPTSGRVSFDGRDARECPLAWLREQVGVLQQDTILFSGTIRDNIAYGRPAASWRISECAELAGATDFIDGLPDGLDTVLGPGGAGLSGGQRQRIGIARVLLRDPPILVLDEPTTGLDAESERRVMAGISSLMEGRTTLFITHSLALARGADLVVVMAGGRVAEVGPPEDLLSGPSSFTSLWSSQDPARPAPSRT